MKRLAKLFCVAGLMLCNVIPAFSYSAKDLVGAETYASLKKSGVVSTYRFGQKNYSLSYLPNTELCKKVPSTWNIAENPTYVCEYLYLLPKKSDISQASKVIRSISKMNGIQYYSHSHKKVETLYKQAYCFNPFNGNTIADPVSGSADGLNSACTLEDNSLGMMSYALNYRQTAEEVSVTFSNLSVVSIKMIKAVEPGNLKMNMVITDCGDEVLIYVVGRAKFPEIAVFENKMNDSISARVEALFTWFKSQF